MSKMVPNPQTWLTIVYSVGFSHYLLGAIYSRQQFREAYAQPLSLFPVLVLAIFGIGLYSLQFPLLIFFALHHAFNEAYVLKQTTPGDDSAISPFRSSAFMLHLFLYFILLRRSQSLGIIELNIFYLVLGSGGQGVFSSELLWGGLLVSYILFV